MIGFLGIICSCAIAGYCCCLPDICGRTPGTAPRCITAGKMMDMHDCSYNMECYT